MAKSNKLISGIPAETPVSHAARDVLDVRLESVRYFLPRAAYSYHDDAEYVHQLRVSTRRAVEALDSFRPLLPRRRLKWFEKQLRRIRRAAGPARDDDVLIERFGEFVSRHPGAAADQALETLREDRRQVQKPLKKLEDRLGEQNIDRRIAKLLARIRFRSEDPTAAEPRFDQWAHLVLVPLVDEWLAAAAGSLRSIPELHQLRILGKRVRYTLEIYIGVMPDIVRDVLYPQVEEMQTRLGTINDHASAKVRFEQWSAAAEEPLFEEWLTQVADDESARAEEACEEFWEWWHPARQAEINEQFRELFSLLAHKPDDFRSPASEAAPAVAEKSSVEENPPIEENPAVEAV